VLTRTIPVPGPVDLRLTLGPLRHGFGDPTIRLTATQAQRATRTPDGPASLELLRRSDEVEATAWGPGGAWALEHAPELVGCRDDPGALRPRHRLVRDLAVRVSGLRLCRSRAVMETLVPTIVEQRVTSAESMRSIQRMTHLFGEPAPGPLALRLPPDPELLASLPYYELHRVGVERRRAELVRAVCRHRGRLEEIVDLPSGEAERRLTALPGIGPWTSAYVRQVALGDPDAVITGDFHFPHTVAWALAGEERAGDERMLELLEPYRGQRGRVQRLIVVGSPRAPRRGWKRPLRRIATI
jgi:3-methyladenine DNA glycosylase/8-oxoguanine DNA glycosylase